MYKKILLTLALLSISTLIYAQRVAVSTDVLKWGSISPNLSIDLVLSSRLSLNLEGVFDPLLGVDFERTNLSAELRYWFERPLYSHYLGINIGTSVYDMKYKSNRYKGQMVALGIVYGYSFIINRHISLTPNIGFGYGYVRSYSIPEQVETSPIQTSFQPVLTQIGVSFSYIIN